MDILGMGFKRTFGFRPSGLPGMKDHEQEFVDAKLTDLAGSFQVWVKAQSRSLTDKPSKGATLKETREHARNHKDTLQTNEVMLRATKNSFWRAHKLAKKRRYTVHTKYTDYLREKVR